MLDLLESSSSLDECRLAIFLESFLSSSLDAGLASLVASAAVDAVFVVLDQSRQSCCNRQKNFLSKLDKLNIKSGSSGQVTDNGYERPGFESHWDL